MGKCLRRNPGHNIHEGEKIHGFPEFHCMPEFIREMIKQRLCLFIFFRRIRNGNCPADKKRFHCLIRENLDFGYSADEGIDFPFVFHHLDNLADGCDTIQVRRRRIINVGVPLHDQNHTLPAGLGCFNG